MLEPEIELVVGSKLNFDKPFFQFNEKKYMERVIL